ncbi:MAG: hypothetical protein COV34_00865, partial [Candidatus Zambryskibacteria bacterium CG10_big_fil_rev_8_21_14_0_10_42_12]
MAHQGPQDKNNEKTPKKQVKLVLSKGPQGPKAPLWMNVVTTIVILLVIASLYSYVREQQNAVENIPISAVAQDIREGEVTAIDVRGTKLELTYVDETVKEAQRETDSSLVETLRAYG